MEPQCNNDEKHWFVLHFIRPTITARPQTYIDTFNRDTARVELFAPTIKPAQIVDGQVVFKERLLTYHYVFVKGTLNDVKELCATQGNGFSFLIDRGSEKRYGIVSDSAMHSFRQIARLYDNTLPFYNIADIALEEGDLVEIVDGPYAGLTGTFMPKSRSSKGNFVIAATAAIGTVLWDIEARYIRILRFALDTRRQYDQLEAFIQKLLPIMRKYHSGEALAEKDKSQLRVFCTRMEVVAPDNHKFEAKLLGTLMCAQHILGDLRGAQQSAHRFQRRRKAVTNVWTQALISLFAAVMKGDTASLTEPYTIIANQAGKLTASQTQLLDEYRYYLRQ